MIEQTYRIDMIPDGAPVVVHVSQYDTAARRLSFELYNGGVAYELPAGAVVSIAGTKPDNTSFLYAMTVSGNLVSIDLQQQMALVAGDVPAEIQITGAEGKIGSANFIIRVERGPIDENSVISETDLPIFQQLVSDAQTAASNAAKSASQAASSASAAAASKDASAEYLEQIGTHTAGAVADWLQENIQPTTPAVDASLSVSGAAADAKKTGDAVSDLNQALIDGYRCVSKWANGSWNDNPPRLNNTNTRIRPDEFVSVVKGDSFIIRNGSHYKHAVGIWKGTISSATTVRNDNQFNVNDEVVTIEDDGFFIVAFADSENTSLVLNPDLFDGSIMISTYARRAFEKAEDLFEKAEDYAKTVTGKNLIEKFEDQDVTKNGIRYIIDSLNKKVIIKAGTATSTSFIDVTAFSPQIDGDYFVSGIPELPSGIRGKVVGYMQNPSTSNPVDKGSGAIESLSKNLSYGYRIIVYSGYTNEEDIEIYPSLIFKNAFDKTLTEENKGADAKAVGDRCNYLLELIHEIAEHSGADINPIQLSFLGNPILGDCNTLQYTDGTVVMIDCMTAEEYARLKADLVARNISKINIFILSHYHSDHAGNILSLLNDGYIDSNTVCYMPPDLDGTYDHSPYPDSSRETWIDILVPRCQQIISALTKAGCTIVYPTEGQEITVCNSTIKFVNCDHDYLYGYSSNYNDWSLCCYLFNGDMSVFYSGDIGPIAMSHIAENIYKANIYKSDHHGWANNVNGLIPAYINRLVPDVVISENSDVHFTNGYVDSPTSPIQAYCECNGVPHYMTNNNGHEINVHLDKFNWKFKGKYVRYIRGTNHKNWKWIDNDTEYDES